MRAELLAEKEGRDTENVNAAKMAEDRQSIVVLFFGACIVSRKFRVRDQFPLENSRVIQWNCGSKWITSVFERSSMDLFG